jgi:hypothetical protein
MTGTTLREESTRPTSDRLLMAIELGRQQWQVGFTTQLGQHIHRRTLRADAWSRLADMVGRRQAASGSADRRGRHELL